jgi:hypothetical protein
MRPWTLLASGLLALILVVPSPAQDVTKDNSKTASPDKKKDDTKKADTKKADKKPAADDQDDTKEKPAKKEKMYNVRRIFGKVVQVDMRSKKLVLSIPLSRLGGDRYHPKVDTQYKNVDLDLSDEVTVRRRYPPPAIDERGHPKRYTRKELHELKGPNKKAWGYSAEFDDVKKDDEVLVFIGQHKPAGHGKNKADADNRPLAYSIRIYAEPVK